VHEVLDVRKLFLGVCLLALAVPAAAAPPIRVLVRNIEPFFFRDHGELAGIDYDLLTYFSKRTGRKLEFIWVDQFDDLLRRLAAGDADVVASGITLTAAREEKFDDSGPYLPVRIILVEPSSHTTTDLAQLRGKTLATMKGSTYEAVLSKVPMVNLVYGVDEADLIGMVADGRAAAAGVDTVPALYRLPKYPGLHMTLPLSEPQAYCYYVPKGSPLAGELAKHIAQLRGSGIYYNVLKRYLGPKAADMVKAAQH
jgi:ABC-type amino acid transport substrate-binding protein